MKSRTKSLTVTRAQYDKRIILALRQVMQQMDLHSRRIDKSHGITVPQLMCLYEIHEHGAMTLSVLSQRVHLSTSTLVGVIDRLEEKQFVRRNRNMQDRRAIFIDITPVGQTFVRTAPQLLHNRLRERLATLSEDEQIIIANSLDLLAKMLQD